MGQGCTIKAMVINVDALSSRKPVPLSLPFVQVAQTEGAGHLSPWVCPTLSWVTIWNRGAVTQGDDEAGGQKTAVRAELRQGLC